MVVPYRMHALLATLLASRTLLQMLPVTLAGLDAPHAAHNGKSATIFEWDEASGLYEAVWVDGPPVAVDPLGATPNL